MLARDKTAMILIDVQEKLFQLMPNKQELARHTVQLIQGLQALEIPILWSEQYPQGMGSTIPAVGSLLPAQTPIAKRSFSCCGHEPLKRQIHAVGRSCFLLAGIEAHICVYQTAVDLLELGYEVEVVADAVASRAPENRQIGLERVRRAGAALTSVETVLFELLRVAEGPLFKEILAIVK